MKVNGSWWSKFDIEMIVGYDFMLWAWQVHLTSLDSSEISY